MSSNKSNKGALGLKHQCLTSRGKPEHQYLMSWQRDESMILPKGTLTERWQMLSVTKAELKHLAVSQK